MSCAAAEMPFAAPLRAVDHVGPLERGTGLRLCAAKRVRVEDPYMVGHFPGLTMLPAVFLLEGLRQTVARAFDLDVPPEVLRIYSVRLLAPMLDGDDIDFAVDLRPQPEGNSWELHARCTRSDGTPVAALRLVVGVPGAERHVSAAAAPPEPTAGVPVIDHVRIRELLPVRHPMLLVDRVDELDPGRRIVTTKAVTGSEPCFQALPEGLTAAHYAYPRSLAFESFGQSAALLWVAGSGADVPDGVLMLAAIRGCRFVGDVQPGESMRHVVRLEHLSAGTCFMSGSIWAGARCIAEVDSLIAVNRPRTEVQGAASVAAC
ncbi:hypothetical protein ACWD4N_00245 [Streptomyces sp. NPDC002586]